MPREQMSAFLFWNHKKTYLVSVTRLGDLEALPCPIRQAQQSLQWAKKTLSVVLQSPHNSMNIPEFAIC